MYPKMKGYKVHATITTKQGNFCSQSYFAVSKDIARLVAEQAYDDLVASMQFMGYKPIWAPSKPVRKQSIGLTEGLLFLLV